jgi:hypothetical protein
MQVMLNNGGHKFKFDFGSLPIVGEGLRMDGEQFVVTKVISTPNEQVEVFIESVRVSKTL